MKASLTPIYWGETSPRPVAGPVPSPTAINPRALLGSRAEKRHAAIARHAMRERDTLT